MKLHLRPDSYRRAMTQSGTSVQRLIGARRTGIGVCEWQWTLVIAAVVALLSGCKRRYGHDDPPPVRSGACVTLSYFGGEPWERRCAWAGYVWNCSSNISGTTCMRGDQLPSESRMVRL